jgi:hypothetical protein
MGLWHQALVLTLVPGYLLSTSVASVSYLILITNYGFISSELLQRFVTIRPEALNIKPITFSINTSYLLR